MYSSIQILSTPSQVGADHLIAALAILSRDGVNLPFWTYQVWKVIDKGNCRTWHELMEDLYMDKERFGERVKELEGKMAPVLSEVKPMTKEEMESLEEELEARLENLRQKKRYERAEQVVKLKHDILASGCDPKVVAKVMRESIGKLSPEDEQLIEQVTSDPMY